MLLAVLSSRAKPTNDVDEWYYDVELMQTITTGINVLRSVYIPLCIQSLSGAVLGPLSGSAPSEPRQRAGKAVQGCCSSPGRQEGFCSSGRQTPVGEQSRPGSWLAVERCTEPWRPHFGLQLGGYTSRPGIPGHRDARQWPPRPGLCRS